MLAGALLVLPAFASAAPAAIFRERVIPGPPAGATQVVGTGVSDWWFTEFDRNRIGRFSENGTYTEFTVPTPDSGPYGITVGSAIWFTEFKAGKIGKLTLDGVFTEYVIPTPDSGPWGIASVNGVVWFTESAANKIGRVNADGSITELSIPTANAMPRGIAAGLNFRPCFAEFGANKIGCFENNQIVERGLPNPNSGPQDIASWTDRGDMWFTERTGNRIGVLYWTASVAQAPLEEFAIPTPASGPAGIVGDYYEGSVWFTEKAAGQIGFVSPDGRITEYPLMDRSSQPTGIAVSFFVGSVIQFHFLESARNRLVEIRQDAVLVGGAGTSGTWQTEFRFSNVENSPVTLFAGVEPRPAYVCPSSCVEPQVLSKIPANGSSTARSGTGGLLLQGLGVVSVRVLEDGILPSVRARVFNASAPGQSLDLPTIRLSRLTDLNPSLLSFPGAVEDGAAHSNLWLTEATQRDLLDVVIELLDPNGTVVASGEQTVVAGGSVYLVDVIGRLGVTNFPGGQLRVRKIGDSGLLWGFLATVNSDGAISIFSGLNP